MESSGASGALQERGQMRYFSICVVTCIAILIYSSNPSYALDVTLAWDANTEPDLAGYGIYYDTDTGDPYYGTGASDGDSPVDISLDQDEDPDPNVVQFTLYDLPEGTYFFAVTAINTAGLESGYSNEVSYNAPSTCTYSISPANQTFGSSGGTGAVKVTTQNSCSWTAASGSWMTITSGGYGTGSGTVSYSVPANTGTSRTATSSIAGKIFTVTQAGVQTYSITASAGTGGSISPSGSVSVNSGISKTFSITPSTGYKISSVTVDGSSVGALSSYTFTNVTNNHTISATFAVATPWWWWWFRFTSLQ